MKLHERLGMCEEFIVDDGAFILWACIFDVISRKIRVNILYHVFCFD